MSDPLVLVSNHGAVRTFTLNRPQALNSFTAALHRELLAGLDAAAADAGVRCVVLTGAGRGFCAGLDLAVIGSGVGGKGVGAPPPSAPRPAPQWGDDIGPDMGRFFAGGWNGLITSRKPTIAAINGPVFGWGFILSLHCDIRFAARSALFNATFARLGIPGEKNAAWLLSRLIGTARSADLLYSARRFDGAEAERLGIVNAVLDDDALMAHVAAYAANIVANSAPRSLAAIKAQIWTAQDDCYDQGFVASDLEQDRATQTADFREGITSLRDKRAPAFKGN
jgi:enoyl-CoA hydratase/carnithine racemase